LFIILLLTVLAGCSDSGPKTLFEMPISSASDCNSDNLKFISDITFDGNGSLAGEFESEARSLLFEINNPEVSGKNINCTVNIKTEMLSNFLILEMIIVMPDGGAKVINTHDPLIRRTTDWKPLTLVHRFAEGQNPQKISFFLHNQNYGRYWADDITVTVGDK
jgi:hypothetical protein